MIDTTLSGCRFDTSKASRSGWLLDETDHMSKLLGELLTTHLLGYLLLELLLLYELLLLLGRVIGERLNRSGRSFMAGNSCILLHKLSIVLTHSSTVTVLHHASVMSLLAVLTNCTLELM